MLASALAAAGAGAPLAAVSRPVLVPRALFAVEVLQAAVRSLTDARIEMGLRSGFRTDLTVKRARLEYAGVDSPETSDLLRRAAAGPGGGAVKQTFDDMIGLAAVAVRVKLLLGPYIRTTGRAVRGGVDTREATRSGVRAAT